MNVLHPMLEIIDEYNRNHPFDFMLSLKGWALNQITLNTTCELDVSEFIEDAEINLFHLNPKVDKTTGEFFAEDTFVDAFDFMSSILHSNKISQRDIFEIFRIIIEDMSINYSTIDKRRIEGVIAEERKFKVVGAEKISFKF